MQKWPFAWFTLNCLIVFICTIADFFTKKKLELSSWLSTRWPQPKLQKLTLQSLLTIYFYKHTKKHKHKQQNKINKNYKIQSIINLLLLYFIYLFVWIKLANYILFFLITIHEHKNVVHFTKINKIYTHTLNTERGRTCQWINKIYCKHCQHD